MAREVKPESRGPRTPWALLERVVPHLGGYRDQLVLVGGLAKRLYVLVDEFAAPVPASEATKDVDFALHDPLMIADIGRLHQALEIAGLRSVPITGLSHTTVSCTYYPIEIERPTALDPHLEFIVPLRGPEREEPISRPQRDDLHAHPLRFVDLLLHQPLVVEHPTLGRLRIPHPLAYIVQKTRIRERREHERKQARDQADAFYVILGFQRTWKFWIPMLAEWRQKHEWSQWVLHVIRTWADIYAAPTSRGALEVASADEFRGHFTPADVVRIMDAFRKTVGLN